MEDEGHIIEQTAIDTSIMFTAAITSLSQKDEYIPPQECEEMLNQIEGLLTMHQEFVSQFLPDINDVKSLLPPTPSVPVRKAGEISIGEISI